MLVLAQEKILKAETLFESPYIRSKLKSHSAFKSYDSFTSQEGVLFATGLGGLFLGRAGPFWSADPPWPTGYSMTWMLGCPLQVRGSLQADFLLQSDRKRTPVERRWQEGFPFALVSAKSRKFGALRGQQITTHAEGKPKIRGT